MNGTLLKQIKSGAKTFLQRLYISIQFIGKNSLANHAAACAYGFLLSIMPLLLIIFFLLFRAFNTSPLSVISMLESIPFLETVINEQWLTDDFFAITIPGVSGVIFILSIFWAGRLLAVSLQRGLRTIFTGKKKHNPVTNNLITIAIEILALVFSLIIIFCSQTALYLFTTFDFFSKTLLPEFVTSKLGSAVFTSGIFGLVSYCAYRFVPANPPRRISALWGSVLCIFSYECTAAVLGILLRQSRYNFLYGALGNLIVLLINVYFLFLFFFIGSQFAFVTDTFDALHFIWTRKARIKPVANSRIALFSRLSNAFNNLFFPIEGNLQKYYRFHKQGEIIFIQEDKENEIYYLLGGEVEVLILSSGNMYRHAATLGAGSFFGEMSYMLSEDRSATIRAKTDISALALPPLIFDDILRFDNSLDRTIIEHLSRRIKNVNNQIAALP